MTVLPVADSAGLTTPGTVLGTPEYMAPEVIVDDGRSERRASASKLTSAA